MQDNNSQSKVSLILKVGTQREGAKASNEVLNSTSTNDKNIIEKEKDSIPMIEHTNLGVAFV